MPLQESEHLLEVVLLQKRKLRIVGVKQPVECVGGKPSYLGLVPRTKQSAHHCYHGPITKAGNVHARTMLVQACQTLGRNPGPLGVFFRRMKKKKCHNVAVIAAGAPIYALWPEPGRLRPCPRRPR